MIKILNSLDDKAKEIVAEFKKKLSNADSLNKEVLEPIVNDLIKKIT